MGEKRFYFDFVHPRRRIHQWYSLPIAAAKTRVVVASLESGELVSLLIYGDRSSPVVSALIPHQTVPTVGGQPVKVWEATLVLDRAKVMPFVVESSGWRQWFEAMRAAAYMNTPLLIALSKEEYERLSRVGLGGLKRELPEYVAERLHLLERYLVDGEDKPVLLVARFGRRR